MSNAEPMSMRRRVDNYLRDHPPGRQLTAKQSRRARKKDLKNPLAGRELMPEPELVVVEDELL